MLYVSSEYAFPSQEIRKIHRGTAALGLPRREEKWIMCQNVFKISIYNHLFWYNLKSILQIHVLSPQTQFMTLNKLIISNVHDTHRGTHIPYCPISAIIVVAMTYCI